MNQPVSSCKVCGKSLPARSGKGRRRVYCGDACRNVAYLARRDDAPRIEPSDMRVEPMAPTNRDALDRWVQEGTRFDDIIDSPEVLARFMDELLVRIGVYSLLEDYRYQRAVNQLIVIYFMIGRMTDGDYRLPCVVR